MAILTLDDVIAGMRPPETLYKVGPTFEGAGLPTSLWYTAGRPGAGVAPSSGINGAAISAPLSGQIPRTNPGAGNAHLARLAAQAGIIGTLWLCDRLWANSGLSVTSTTAQAITPATLPARDRDGTTNGEDVLCGVEWSAAGGAGVPTVTLTYTDQSGNTGATASFVGQATPAQGLLELFPLAAGDTGVRAPTSFIQSATRTSGTMHLVMFRILAQIPVTVANVLNYVDFLTSGGPRIYDDSVPFLVWVPTSATATTVFGQYIETQG